MKSITSIILAAFLVLLQVTNGLHFYLRTGETRCFFEELPQDSLVVGKIDASEYNEATNDYHKNQNLRVEITVDVCIF